MKKNPPDFGDLLSFLLLFLLSVSLVQFFLFFFTLMNVNTVRRNKAKSVKKKKVESGERSCDGYTEQKNWNVIIIITIFGYDSHLTGDYRAVH